MKQLFYINPKNSVVGTQKVLSMRIGAMHFSFAITDKTGTELYSLTWYSADEMNAGMLASIYSNHPELQNSFYKVQVSFDHPGSILVPQQYHNPDNAKVLLNTMYGNTTGSSVISESINEWQIYNVYAVPNDVHEWVSRIFQSYKCRHNYTLSMKKMASDPADHMLIDFYNNEFSFIVVKEGKLLIAQTFSYSSPEDILYYLLKTCNEYSLSREEIQLFISGLIEKESQLYRELYLYFLNIVFREPAWSMQVKEEKEYPSHFFTSLNDLAQCAS